MKQILAILIATFTLFSAASLQAGSFSYDAKSIDSISSPMICASHGEEEKKKKKKGEEEEEPECE